MQLLATNDAPKAIGPYSQGLKSGNTIYTSGQIPLDPATGELAKGDFAVQTRRVFANLKAILTAAGAELRHVVKATVYVTDLANFQTLNAIYAEEFGEHKPARTTVQVAALPKGAELEIDLVAVVE
jgi:2-iminobutanoate/2-iminopropanoate deaminase